MLKEEDIIELSLENGVTYKIYLPFKESDHIQKTVFQTQKPYEHELLSYILTLIPPHSTLLDIGMNIANHSLFLAANGFKVHAFEANTKMSAIAKESIRLNGFEDRVRVYEFGVSDKNEKAYFAKEIPLNFGGMALSLADENCGCNLDLIECKSIDSLGLEDDIALIKIDIEGMEAKALRGMEKLIAKNRPVICAEANYVDDFLRLDRILNSFNYVHWDIFGVSPMHLYKPFEKISPEQMLQKSLSNSAVLRLYFTGYKHSCFLHNTVGENKQLNLSLRKEVLALKNKELERVKHLKNTLTYRWGKSLLESSRSLCKFLLLPLSLYKDYRAFKLYIKKRRKKDFNP